MQKFCPNNELCKYQVGSQCRDKCASESSALSACYPAVPRKNWRHSNGYICCGTMRIMKADFDTSPSDDVKKQYLDAICEAMNTAG